jgi:acyl carrier protein
MGPKERFVQMLKEEFSCEIKEDTDLSDCTVLVDLGVTSMDLITVLLTLDQEYGINLKAVIQDGTPTTVGDVVRLLQSPRPE